MKCITCHIEHENTFCPNCGEKGDVPEITFSSIFNAGMSTITNMDKGFLYNFKQLFLNPQKLIQDYIAGKRKGILNPISYLIIAVTIYLIFEALLHVGSSNEKLTSKSYEIGYQAGGFLRDYFKYFWISSILWLSLSTRLVFKQYSLAEHLAINAFVLAQTTLVIATLYLIFKLKIIFNPIVYLVLIILIYKIYQRKSKDVDRFLMSVSAIMIFFVMVVVVVVGIGWVRTKMI